MDRIGKKDKAVIRAFTERRALDGYKLTTDGKRLDIYSLGGRDIAHWKDGKIHFPGSHGSRSGQLVERAIAREAPKNDLYNGRGYNPKRRNQEDDPTRDVDYDLALELMDWHGGQGSDLYAVASSALAGRKVQKSTIEGAATDLRRAAGKARGPDKQRANFLADMLDDIAEGREVYYDTETEDFYEKSNPRGRAKNTHDSSTSARDAEGLLSRTISYVGEASEQVERGNMASGISSLLEAAYWLGHAAANAGYAEGRLDRRVVEGITEYREYIRRGTWGEAVAKYCGAAAANPRRRRTRKATKRRTRRNPPARKFAIGDKVRVGGPGSKGINVVGTVQHYGEYDDHAGSYRVRVRDQHGNAKYWSEKSLRKVSSRRRARR